MIMTIVVSRVNWFGNKHDLNGNTYEVSGDNCTVRYDVWPE